jgi:hypothetical protein
MSGFGLYKQLVRYGRNLKYTEKRFYFRRIRSEFEKNRELTDPKDIKLKIDQGFAFLKRGALL